ncbi:hypothetical protein F4703DRAFT_1893736 [Phycomyces blakesleeanus]
MQRLVYAVTRPTCRSSLNFSLHRTRLTSSICPNVTRNKTISQSTLFTSCHKVHISFRATHSLPILGRKYHHSNILCTVGIVPTIPLSHLHNKPSSVRATPSEIEAAGKEPSSHHLVRLCSRIFALLDHWIFEPLLTLRRFTHILLLFVPVALSAPVVFLGKRTKDGNRSGTLWWYDFVAMEMERAGPTFIKLAQWIASRTDLFPSALCTRLSRLHSQVDPHQFSHTKRVIEAAFGQSMESVFSSFDPTPLGVGAIAQVYKATLYPEILNGHPDDQSSLINDNMSKDTVIITDKNGEQRTMHTTVAIKVIHPKAYNIVNRDLKIMNFFAQVLTFIPTFHWLSLPDEVRVFGAMMKDQLDLRIEGRNLERFNELFCNSLRVEFPKPLLGFTTKDMLIEEYENGIPLSMFLENAAYAKKMGEQVGIYDHKLADIGLDVFLHMLIFHNFVHADLHPGNIMVKFYKPSAYHPLQKAWSNITGKELKDDGDKAVDKIMALRHDPEAVRKELDSLESEGYAPRLVFIDTGLVNELDDVNRRNFLDLFQAIAQFDGYKAGELMIERCRSPELVINSDIFALRMQNLIIGLKQNTFKLGAVRIGGLLNETMNMVRSHHVKLEGDFVNVIVSIMLLEGIGRQLDPGLDLFKMALPVLREYSIKDHGQATIEGMKDVKQSPFSPHWIKVWIFLELRNWLGENKRDEEWLSIW